MRCLAGLPWHPLHLEIELPLERSHEVCRPLDPGREGEVAGELGERDHDRPSVSTLAASVELAPCLHVIGDVSHRRSLEIRWSPSVASHDPSKV
jgi:hypothetical protein